MRRRNTYNGRLYKEDPTIFAWDILNEPRQTSGDYSTVQKWIDMMASFVKSVDPNHMVRRCCLWPNSSKDLKLLTCNCTHGERMESVK